MTKITDNVYYVGVADGKTASSNAYLVIGNKAVLIDTVPEKNKHELVENIERVIPISQLDYVVCNHSEPNRSGALSYILEKNPDVVVIATIAGLKNLKKISNVPFKEMVAKNGASLDLGSTSLDFLITPNLHWPDTMLTYSQSDKVLFSCDFLSTDYTTKSIYDSELDNFEAFEKKSSDYFDKYFSAGIPFARLALEKINDLMLIYILCGSGPVLNKHLHEILALYKAKTEAVKDSSHSVAVIYDSVYGFTEKLAVVAYTALQDLGCSARIYNARECDTASLLQVVDNSSGVLLGTPTIERNASELIWQIVTSLNLAKAKSVLFGVFGSYGWSGEGTALIHSTLNAMRLHTLDEPLKVIFNPSEDAIEKMKQFATKLANSIK